MDRTWCFSCEFPEKEPTNTTLLPGFINHGCFLELLGITQLLTQHEPRALPGGSQGIGAACPPQPLAPPGSWLLLQGLCPRLATQQHWEAAHLLESGCRSGCKPSVVPGARRRPHNVPSPGGWAQLQNPKPAEAQQTDSPVIYLNSSCT